jgi:peptidoglycan hydrolase CwlO-like protein
VSETQRAIAMAKRDIGLKTTAITENEKAVADAKAKLDTLTPQVQTAQATNTSAQSKNRQAQAELESFKTDAAPVLAALKEAQAAYDAAQTKVTQAKAAVELLERGEWGEVYNLGSETGVKIYRLAEMIGSLMGCRIEVKLDPKKVRPWEIWHLQSDNTKIYNVIKHRPQVTLIEALQKTIAYYHRTGRKWIWEKSNVDFKSDIG